MTATRFNLLSAALFAAVNLSVAAAQEQPATQPAEEQPAAEQAGGKQPIMARVIEVHGDVKHAPLESDDYKPCQLNDEYPERTKIITGVRSSIKLQIGDEQPYTCMLVDAVGKTVLSEAYRTETTKKVRVGVGYGRIRAGVAEGGLQSDFVVDSPVATLSKRGTWGFTLFYERDTNLFEIGLSERGLVEAIDKLTRQRRTLHPHELVTQAMRMWLDQAKFERNVPVPDFLGQGDIEVVYNRLETDGLGVLEPGEGKAVLIDLSNQSAQRDFARILRGTLPPGAPLPPVGRQLRAEGFFGTGRGDELIPVMIEATSPLAQQGFAKPGRYTFRREALEGWLRNYDRKP